MAEGLDPVFAAKVDALVKASGGRIKIVSGYRSVERQSRLWNDAVARYGSAAAARKWVAPPGKSNHNKGKAVDLGGDLALAKKLAPGLGLHFPMAHEPWHVEPVGHRGSKDAYTTPPTGQQEVKVAPDATSTGLPTTTQVFAELGSLLMGATDDG